jgi:hypothetical protein
VNGGCTGNAMPLPFHERPTPNKIHETKVRVCANCAISHDDPKHLVDREAIVDSNHFLIRSEAVNTTLLLPLTLIQRLHPLRKSLILLLSALSRLALLLKLLHAQSRTLPLLLRIRKLLFKTHALASPSLHLALHLRARRLEIGERLFESGGELFLGEEVLFDSADARFLVFDELGLGNVFALVSRDGRRWRAGSSGRWASRKRGQGDCWRW